MSAAGAQAEAKATSLTFENVRVAVINEDGATKPKYPHAVVVIAEYDPEVS